MGLLNLQPAWLALSGAVRSRSLSEPSAMLMSPPISVLAHSAINSTTPGTLRPNS